MSLAQNPKVQEYLNSVCSHIKWGEVHGQVKLELLAHIEDCVLEYTAEGMAEQQAIEMAINRMGDSVALGKQLHQTHKPPINWQLISIVSLLAGMGLFTLYSVEMQGLLMRHISVLVFTKSLVYVAIGLAVLLGVAYFDYRKLKLYGRHLFAGTMFIWLLLLMFGGTINGKPFFILGFFSINYVDLTPVLLAVALAGIFLNKDWSKPNWFVNTLLLLLVPNILYLNCLSASAAVIYTVVFLVLMLMSGASKKQLAVITAIPISMNVLAIVTEPYRLRRILTFLNPYQDPAGSGYIHIQSIETIKSAGLWGQGFNFGGNLPELHTDLIFSYLVYTFGWVSGAVVAMLALALIVIMIGAAKQVKDRFGRLLISGLTSILALHFIWNILMTLGYAPITGISLPFFSYGGSQTVINMAMMGIVLSVYRRKNLLASSGN
jgi:cell division protein FtsW (lipid II flippase)